MLLSQFKQVGGDLFSRGLVSTHGGNLSVRMGDRITITRRGSKLGYLDENDLIETGVARNDRATPLASLELPVHRAIYQETAAQAVVHAHAPYTIALSLVDRDIVPQCVEGLTSLGNVPVVGWNMDVKPGSLAEIIAQSMKINRIVVVRGHGTFAMGQLLEEAVEYTHTLESACQIICILKSIKK